MPQFSVLFQFNQYSALLLPFVLQGIIMSLLLFRRGKIQAQLPDVFLGMLLLLYTFRISSWMLGFAGWYDVRDWHSTFMFYFPFNLWLAVGPIIYMYFLSATNHAFRLQRKHLLHFIPVGLFLLKEIFFFVMDIVVNHWISGETLPDFYGTRGYWGTNGFTFMNGAWLYLETFSVLIYLIITLRLFYRYRGYINNHFSDMENIELSWLRNFLIVNLIGTVIWIGFSIVNLFLDEPLSYIEDWYSFFFLGIILYYLSIAGYQNGTSSKIVEELQFNPAEPEAETAQDSNIEVDHQIKELYTKLLHLMDQNEIYLDAGLTLNKLSSKLNCNSNLLSKTINSLAGKNFNDFINEYRIERFKEKARDPNLKQYSLLALAVDSGFNSKATFNRAFKKVTGLSPSAYLKNS